MPAFDPNVAWGADDALDWRLIQNGYVGMFFRPAVLASTVEWLTERSYHVVRLDAGAWETQQDLHSQIADALGFPAYYGRNLNALNDCLWDVAMGEYGWPKDATGLVLVLDHFDAFARRDPEVAHALLDIFASEARIASLVGNRMLCLLRSDDPDITFPPVGASPVLWNPDERLDSKRHGDHSA